MGWSTTVIVPPDGDMNDYIISLKKLISREEELFLPTHGPVIEKPKKLLQDYIAHRLDRERQILEAISKGNCKIPDMVKIIYKDVDPQLHSAAAMSTLAHLHRMINNNEVLVEGKNLDANYNLV
jgi:glyoxylase-like metal-dependent hydrolase (beta-lactamase superfamily II)